MLIELRKIWQWIALFLLFIASDLGAQTNSPLKVLFVGNSYTYFWNLPQTVNAMAASQNLAIEARQSTAGGVNLRQHWEGDKGLNTRELIAKGDWDIVVIQNHSLSSLNDYAAFMEYGKKFIKLVRDSGATPLLYATWAREHNPLTQKHITKAYKALAEETGVKMVPVGPLWEQARMLRPDLGLFDPDGSHPSPTGTYLAALTFYAALSGNTTAAIPERIVTTDRNGDKLYLSIMSEENADFMQQLIDEYMQTAEPKKK